MERKTKFLIMIVNCVLALTILFFLASSNVYALMISVASAVVGVFLCYFAGKLKEEMEKPF